MLTYENTSRSCRPVLGRSLPTACWRVALVALVAFPLATTLAADEGRQVTAASGAAKTVYTTIVVKGLHCESCAKKLMARLNTVRGVASSQADAKKGLALVVPKNPRQLPSPRAQWEAVEKAGYTPVKLQGPLGTFTSKPKR